MGGESKINKATSFAPEENEPAPKGINFDNLSLMSGSEMNFEGLGEDSDSESKETDQIEVEKPIRSQGFTLDRINLLDDLKDDPKYFDGFVDEEEINKSNKADELEFKMRKAKSSFSMNNQNSLAIGEGFSNFSSTRSMEDYLKVIKVNDHYREKLRLALRAIRIRDLHIQNLKSDGSVVPLDMANSRLHLAFMFSSPLIRKFNGIIENVAQLDCQTEIKDIAEA